MPALAEPQTSLPVLLPHADCTKCSLCESATRRGIPTRLLSTAPEGSRRAILVVGEKPGVFEDRLGRHFVGDTGRYLSKVMLAPSKVDQHADIYCTNAVRCKPPEQANVTKSQLNACKDYLVADLTELKSHYDEVLILACGAGAARMLRDSSLGAALLHQGEETLLGCPTFYTFNPYILNPKRDPTAINAIADHMAVLVDYLDGSEFTRELQMPEIERAVPSPGCLPEMLSIDIETYGAVDGLPQQTVFQPQRSLATDAVTASDLIQTVALAWRMPDGHLRTSIYNFQDTDDLYALDEFLDRCSFRNIPLLGMNTQFDVLYLRSSTLGYLFRRSADEQPWQLRDLAVINYLSSEVRPERSLKSLSPLLQVTDYDDELNLRAGQRYPNAEDPRLHEYNCKDAVATLLLWEKLDRRIRQQYRGTDKLSPYCLDWYDKLLWFAIESSEAGVTFDRGRLEELNDRLLRQVDRIVRFAAAKWGAPLQGKGSKSWVDKLAQDAASELDLLSDRRLALTKARKEVSSCGENLNLFLGLADKRSDLGRKLRVLQLFRERSKLQNSFTGPMLFGRKKGKQTLLGGVLLDDRVHPTWYVVPSQFEDASTGGTKQGRVTCKSPALQTMPPIVKGCMSTRFTPGVLIGADLSQIELRVGALISGDRTMMEEYANGIDRHLTTAIIILRALQNYMQGERLDSAFGVSRAWLDEALALADMGTLSKSHPGIDVFRQLGKTINFLMLFKGGPNKAQETAARDTGLLLPIDVWRQVIRGYQERYPEFLAWQDGWLRDAVKTGIVGVPLTGQTRLFGGGARGVLEATPEVVNMPIQTIAANVMISAHTKFTECARAQGLQAISPLTIYDAMYIEAPADEEQAVMALLDDCLTAPPYWTDVQNLLGRTVPCAYEAEVLTRRVA